MKSTDDILDRKVDNFEDSLSLIEDLKSIVQLKNSFLEIIFNAIPNPMFYKDKNGIYQNCNDAFSEIILGVDRDKIIGKSLYDFPNEIPKENADIYYKKDNELLENMQTQRYTSKVQCADNVERIYNFYKAVFTSEGEAIGIVGIMMDITESEKQKEKLKYLVTIDPLTELLNKRYFYEISQSILDLDFRNKANTSILMLDIDRFKNINDTFGHSAGDDILVHFSKLLKDECRQSDIICRWGGEEFVILLPGTSSNGAEKIAQKIRLTVENSTTIIDSQELRFTVSIGLYAVFRESGDIKTFISKADKALYKAKDSGRNKVCIG